MAGRSHAVDISKVSNGSQQSRADSVAVEEPLEIRLGYSTADGRASRSVSITMRTPGNDPELAAGFLYTESIIRRADDISCIETCGPPAPDSGNHNVVRVELGPDVSVDLGRLQRHFYTTSSCGVCGKTSLDALRVIGVAPMGNNDTTFDRDVLIKIPDKLRKAQATFDKTGGLHAAGVFTTAGELVVTMEDVGRHNAVDKVIGALLLDDRLPATDLGLMVSGRASFELMQKALVAGMPLLAAVSAPSSLAVQLASEFNMTLVGFLRGDTFNIYSGKQRIQYEN
ncbi:MAG: formate dehydrogenase accessory sulfurtransferase FdhD [Gammaproteobacteria bacterium]|nr:formate dehydrogenase accessory sulfurtransferase FdhD [Gammaproteobacteria bacterium]MDH3374103.1 formate dehydrogenase accessory sulfurtransferase FdhD [Gammaproteobacteria bacterium]MDH3408771.1 formate dehydrogenase accessory sulfurtransferase FdhD [Gammaproteobacteria bacterium]MDH3551179.1 formate dehydrogenase accessory sulfurtransferase FdhD [Gammaproteobacteria bacterium]